MKFIGVVSYFFQVWTGTDRISCNQWIGFNSLRCINASQTVFFYVSLDVHQGGNLTSVSFTPSCEGDERSDGQVGDWH